MDRPTILHIRPYGFEVGSVEKYAQMFGRYADMVEPVLLGDAPFAAVAAEIDKTEFDIGLVGGDWWKHWKGFAHRGRPYILVEHDIHTLRVPGARDEERAMIENASAVLFTSEDHQAYCDILYDLPPSDVIHLRPLAESLKFEPLPRLKGKHLVYAGGLASHANREGAYGYRSYHTIFKAFMEAGWTVHVYPCYLSGQQLKGEYAALGCVVHDEVPEVDLPRELSQYTAGLQAYADQCLPDAFRYTQTCRPNKTWTYLAAGIPTIGYRAGNTADIYDGKWGVILESLDDIPNLVPPKVDGRTRIAQVMDKDAPRFERLLQVALDNPRIPDPSTALLGPQSPPLQYPVALAREIVWEGKCLRVGTPINRETAVALKKAGLLTDPRIF